MPSIIIACPFCFESGNVPEAFFGKRVRCRRCRESFPVTSQVRTERYFFEKDVESADDDSHHDLSTLTT